jgi:nucleoside-diphosphate-sugar epimerase
MSYFTDKLIEISGLKDVVKKKHDPFWRPHEIHYQHGDSTHLIKATGFKEKYNIDTTLSDLLEYWIKKLS